MELEEERLEIKHTSAVIYVKFRDGSKAYLKYEIKDGRMYLLETYTPPQHRGRGVAARLVEYAIKMAEERRLEIVPICSYAISYFIKHEEARRLLAGEYRSMSKEQLEELFKRRLEEERAKGEG
ncbi:MAG: GNAT family N-acetyltransferase [Desulfurococcaceae archaeon]